MEKEHSAVQEQTKLFEAYRQMKIRVDPSGASHYPIELLTEWDDVRCKINPNARLSYAQKLMRKQ